MSKLFGYVECRSMSIDSLGLYFAELPQRKSRSGSDEMAPYMPTKNRTQEDFIDEMKKLVARDVKGSISNAANKPS